jgi:AmmeMemoRadiSam system protein B
VDPLPRARVDLQLMPVQLEGRQVVVVKDPLGLIEEMLALDLETFQLLVLFDGEQTLVDLQRFMMQEHGHPLVTTEQAGQVVQELDELLLLQTPRYRERKRKAREAYARLERRSPAFAGETGAYPEDPAALTEILDELLDSGQEEAVTSPGDLRAVVAPHIDLDPGREVYAAAYRPLRGLRPERLIVLGTGHSLDDGLFSLTDKIYDTPIGCFPTDRAAVAALRQAGGEAVAPDDFAHRQEHSIEYQVLLLRHLLEGEIPLVPVLVGSFDPHLKGARRPAEIPAAADFLEALAALVAQGDALVVAGVDLCHVGHKFGDREPAEHLEPEVRAHDNKLLEAVCSGSVTDLWAEIGRVEDRFQVCGYPALACLLEVLPRPIRGQVLDYRIALEEPTRSAVTFAAVALC